MNSSNADFLTQLVETQKQTVQMLQDIEKQGKVETKKKMAKSISEMFPSKFTEKELKQMMKALTISSKIKCSGITKSGKPCQLFVKGQKYCRYHVYQENQVAAANNPQQNAVPVQQILVSQIVEAPKKKRSILETEDEVVVD